MCPTNQILIAICLFFLTGHFSNITNMEQCTSCISVFGLGWNSNPAQTSCEPLPQNYLAWNETLSTSLLTTSGIFSLLNLIALSLFIKFRNSYVIKGSNRKLTYVLFGILFSCFLSPFVYIGHPNQLMCVIQPTYITLVLTSLMLAILFKTYRILVIFELPPTSLVNIHTDRKLRDRRHFFCLLAVGVFVFGVMCVTTYMITPRVTFHYSDSDAVFIDCGHNWEYLNYVAVSIFGTLTIVSVYMAYRVRKLPENFNEAHQISSAVFILFLVWIVTLIAILTPQAQKKTAYFCISIQVKALVVLLFMILPKLKVVLCNPSKDTPEAIRLQTIAYVMKEQSKPRNDSTSTISTISNLNL